MNIVNLTPHLIRLSIHGMVSEFPSKGNAQVSTTPGEHVANVVGCPIFAAPTFGPVGGLPPPDGESFFIVSAIVAGRPEVSGRMDVCSPGTGPNDGAIRNEKGQIVAVTRLILAPGIGA